MLTPSVVPKPAFSESAISLTSSSATCRVAQAQKHKHKTVPHSFMNNQFWMAHSLTACTAKKHHTTNTAQYNQSTSGQQTQTHTHTHLIVSGHFLLLYLLTNPPREMPQPFTQLVWDWQFSRVATRRASRQAMKLLSSENTTQWSST